MYYLPLLLLLLVGCSSDTEFSSAKSHNIVNKDSEEVLDDADGEAKKPEAKVGEFINFDLTVTSSAKLQAKDTPINFVAVIDSSPSMTANIESLRQSVKRFFDELDISGMPFNIRILPLDIFEKMLEAAPTANPAVTPKGVFSGNAPDYNARGALADKYKAIQVVSSEDSAAQVDALLGQVKNSPAMIDNEFGIGAAFDYFAFIQKNTNDSSLIKFPSVPGKPAKIHFIVISDEDNSDKQIIRNDQTGIETARKDTIIYRRKGSMGNPACSKQDVQTFKKYDYVYSQKDLVNANFTVTYNAKSDCARQGFLDTESAYQLKTTLGCSTRTKTCYKRELGREFTCNAGSYQKTSTSNISNTMKRCEALANNIECEKMRDGKMFWFDVSYTEAVAMRIAGGNCREKSDTSLSTWMASDTSSSTNEFNYFLRSCSAYSCTDNNKEYGYAKQAESLWPSYQRCDDATLLTGQNLSNPYTLSVSSNPSGKLLNIVGSNTCAAGYTLSSTSPRAMNSALYFCESNLATFNLPSGVVKDASVLRQPTQMTVTKVYPRNYTIAQIATNLGVAQSAILSVSQPIDIWSAKSETHYYQKYAVDDPIRTRTDIINFQEVMAEYVDNPVGVAPDAPVADPNVVTKTVYKDNGTVVASCELAVATDKHYYANAADFKTLMTEEFPNFSVTWHSIVHLDHNACPNEGPNSVAARGDQYLDLTLKTGGLSANICSNNVNNYDQFVKELAYLVVNEVDVFYKMPKNMVGKEIASVTNKKSKTELKKDVDYYIVDAETLRFEKGVINIGDKIDVKLKK